MNNYADYSYYQINYLQGREAVIPSASFNFYSSKATRELKNRLPVQVLDINDDVKSCTCELAELFYNEDVTEQGTNSAMAKGVSSERVGEYSVSYSTTEKTTYAMRNREVRISTIINSWLGNKGITNRGVAVVY